MPFRAFSIASGPSRRESVTHWLAHGAVAVARPAFLVLLGATVVLMATLWPLAILTGLVALACGVVLIVGREVEERSEAGDAAQPADDGPPRPLPFRPVDEAARTEAAETTEVPGGEMDSRLLLRGSWTVAGMASVLVAVAVIVGLALFEWRMLLVGIGVVAMYGAFISFPAWFACLEEDAEETTRRLEEIDGTDAPPGALDDASGGPSTK